MDFSFDFFNESMDLLTPNVLEPIEIFETPVEIEKQSTELSLEEITAADQLMDELLSYQPLQVAVDSSKVMQEDKVFETLKPVLDLTQEELYAPDQPLEELLFKQPESLEAKDVDVNNVVTEAGQDIYILTAETKITTPAATSTPSKGSRRKINISRHDKKERKRLQDAQAAQKYRKRKKEEENMTKAEEQALVMKRDKLKSEINGMEAEIKTLKKMMVELGLLPSSFSFSSKK